MYAINWKANKKYNDKGLLIEFESNDYLVSNSYDDEDRLIKTVSTNKKHNLDYMIEEYEYLSPTERICKRFESNLIDPSQVHPVDDDGCYVKETLNENGDVDVSEFYIRDRLNRKIRYTYDMDDTVLMTTDERYLTSEDSTIITTIKYIYDEQGRVTMMMLNRSNPLNIATPFTRKIFEYKFHPDSDIVREKHITSFNGENVNLESCNMYHEDGELYKRTIIDHHTTGGFECAHPDFPF